MNQTSPEHLPQKLPTTLDAPKERIAELYALADQRQSDFALLDRWDLPALLNREITAETPASFAEMLPLWVGTGAVQPVSAERIEEYRDYLSQSITDDRFRALLFEIAGHDDEAAITEADLSAVHSLVHVMELAAKAPLDSVDERPLTILEIGGGYSLLGALVHRYLGREVCYISVDGVPESTAYSEAFLQAAGLDVLFATEPEDLQTRARQCIVAPAWLAHGIAADSVDIAINFSSIQEMPDAASDAYLAAFPRWLRMGGALLFGNSRDYFYKREYRMAPPMFVERKEYSPRSRTLDFPIEIFRKMDAPPAWAQRDVEVEYYIALKERALERQKKINRRYRQTKRLRDRAQEQLQSIRTQSVERREALRSTLAERNDALKARIDLQNQTIANLQGRLESRTEQLGQTIETLQGRIEKLMVERRTLVEDRSEALKARIEKQNQTIETLQGRIEKLLAERRTMVENRNDTLKTRTEKQNQTIENLQGRLESRTEQFGQTIATLQGRVETLTAERKALIEERNALRKENTQIKNKIRSFTALDL